MARGWLTLSSWWCQVGRWDIEHLTQAKVGERAVCKQERRVSDYALLEMCTFRIDDVIKSYANLFLHLTNPFFTNRAQAERAALTL